MKSSEHEYTQGQSVIAQRPGQAPITGTVAHIHTAPGYVAVLDDRYRHVSNYPEAFVLAAEVGDEPACEGHAGEDDDLLNGTNIGETTYCDGSCNPRR